MDCLYCSYTASPETAVGICKCGAGLCRDHVFEQFLTHTDVTTVGPVGRTVSHGTKERQLLCPACAPVTAHRHSTVTAFD